MQVANAPMVPSKFLHLKILRISVRGRSLNRDYDFLSLVSVLHACPSLETFVLVVSHCSSRKVYLITVVESLTQISRPFYFQVSVPPTYDLIVGGLSTLRQMPKENHDKLKGVQITGFFPQKTLVELTRHILESSASLKCLILDTVKVNRRCYGHISRKCSPLDEAYIKEACESIVAVKTYIKGIIPSTVWLNVLGPCSRCHS